MLSKKDVLKIRFYEKYVIKTVIFSKNSANFTTVNQNLVKMKKNYTLLVVMALIFSWSSGVDAQENNNWIAPASSNNMKNPFSGNKTATAEGKSIYNQMCVLCHGATGKGNGAAGLTLAKKTSQFLGLESEKSNGWQYLLEDYYRQSANGCLPKSC